MDKNHKLNFIFWGTPDIAFGTLDVLKESGFIPSYIITAPDKPQGRKMILTPPPVKLWAIKNGVKFIQPDNLKDLDLGIFEEIDLSIAVAYGKIIPENIINLPKMGSINIHYSLLPRYRGASPVESAILNGDKETGVTIQKMEFKMDTGPILASEKIQIGDSEKAPELRNRLMKVGADLLVKILPDFINDTIKPVKQNEEEATYCKKIKKEDGLVDLNDDPTLNYNKFKAYSNWPRIFFFKNNKRIIVTEAEIMDNNFIIKKVLPEGKKEIKYEDFLKTI